MFYKCKGELVRLGFHLEGIFLKDGVLRPGKSLDRFCKQWNQWKVYVLVNIRGESVDSLSTRPLSSRTGLAQQLVFLGCV
jgi:hypothetical protein